MEGYLGESKEEAYLTAILLQGICGPCSQVSCASCMVVVVVAAAVEDDALGMLQLFGWCG